MDTVIDAPTITRIQRSEAFSLAATEYRRFLDVLRGLDPVEWTQRTDCPDWDVREMAAHVLGACESCASVRELVHQQRAGKAWAKVNGRPDIDGFNAVQVADRADLSPQQICSQLESIVDRAVDGRRRVPGLFRAMDIGDGSGGPMRLGWLMEVIYTRDTWMHRVDVLRAVGRLDEMVLTPDHDGRLVADVVAQWAAEHGKPFTLVLEGPAGGRFAQGRGGPELRLDAVEFMRTLSGRAQGTGLLDHLILF